MTIDRLRTEIKLRWNKLNSNHKQDFPDAYLDDIINNATHEYVEMFYSGNNPNKFDVGFEVTQQRTDMLSTLVVPHKAATGVLVSTGIYKVDLNALTPKYRHFLRGKVNATNCGSSVSIPIDLIRHNDFDYKIKDENTKPSLKWRRCLGLIKQDGLYLYTANEFPATSVELEYLKQPVKVFSSTYNSLEYINGDLTAYKTGDPKVTSDLPDTYHTLLVDLAVQLIGRYLQDDKTIILAENFINKTT